MLNAIIDFYNTATNKITTNQLSFSNIIPNIYFRKNSPRSVVEQNCHLVIKYWKQQKTEEFLGAVSHLEQLAKSCPQHDWVILEFLSDFVRNFTAIYPAEVNISPDIIICQEIQAILTLIAKIHRKKYGEKYQLDLSHADLRGANLQKANLEGANLYHVNLAGANLSQANLTGAILSAANLDGANLVDANLAGAILSAANFKQANLTGANLYQANLYLANLQEATLNHAIFEQANLREAKFTEINPIREV